MLSELTPARVRAFVAIEIPPAVREKLAAVQARLQHAPLPVRWVRAESVHLTLEFLGQVEVERLEAIEAARARAASSIRPFDLRVRGAGVFPSWRRPRVIWLGVQGELKELGKLQRGVVNELIPLGFPAEARDFTPHLTLGRVQENAGAPQREEVGRQVQALGDIDCGSWRVSSLDLMQSRLSRSGAVYRSLWNLGLRGR